MVEGWQVRHASKRDENEQEIVDTLEALGFSVHKISDPNGFPDLVCAKGDKVMLIEVKMPGETFTYRQKQWHREWKGRAYVVSHPSEAIEVASLYT